MIRICVLIFCFVAILAACEPISGDLTPTSPNATQSATATHTARPTSTTVAVQTKTATPSPTFSFAPSPTQESVDRATGLDWYRVERTVNVRTCFRANNAECPSLYQLQPGVIVLAYDPPLNMDGINWLWVINGCGFEIQETGYAARTSGSTIFLQVAPEVSSANC